MAMVGCESPSSTLTSSFRRKTMAAGEPAARFAPGYGRDDVQTPRRQSFVAEEPVESNDWELPRLDIWGFVVDYISYRASECGLEWYDAPELPHGVQPEYLMMRDVCTIFERRNKQEIESLAEQLCSSSKLTFPIYSEVVQLVGWSIDESVMSYGRMIGLITFAGLVASKMLERPEERDQVRNLSMYTSLFIKSLIRVSWKIDGRNWAGFMKLGRTMMDRQNNEEESTRNRRRRWSIIGLGTAAAIVGVGVAIVGGKVLLNHRG